MTVLCLVEYDGDEVAAPSLAALTFARALAVPVTAVVFGAAGSAATGVAAAAGSGTSGVAAAAGSAATGAAFAASGVAAVCYVQAPELTGYAPVAWARSLQQLAAARGASAVVAAATDRGGEVLAQLGALTGLPVAANCVTAAMTGPASWQLVRQRWAGSVLEDATLAAETALLTVAADAVPAGTGAGGPEPELAVFTPELTEADVVVQARESESESSGVSLASARVVVGGGRGVGGPDGFAALEELAALLGGVVGVSRVVTSAGWRPHRQQVGQTGTKIAPELYLACGISGAIQHMAGCQGARHLIAINTDAGAPIISRAEYAVIGDLHEVIPALVAAIKATLTER
jgi:electron transfer flavoprotein alpha subunit